MARPTLYSEALILRQIKIPVSMDDEIKARPNFNFSEWCRNTWRENETTDCEGELLKVEQEITASQARKKQLLEILEKKRANKIKSEVEQMELEGVKSKLQELDKELKYYQSKDRLLVNECYPNNVPSGTDTVSRATRLEMWLSVIRPAFAKKYPEEASNEVVADV